MLPLIKEGGGGGRIKVFASDCFGNIVLPDTDVFGGDGVSFADEGSLHFESTIPCGNANPPPVGINELFASNKLNFTIYPNPSLEGNVNLKFGSSFIDLSQADLFVFDVFAGKLEADMEWVHLDERSPIYVSEVAKLIVASTHVCSLVVLLVLRSWHGILYAWLLCCA